MCSSLTSLFDSSLALSKDKIDLEDFRSDEGGTVGRIADNLTKIHNDKTLNDKWSAVFSTAFLASSPETPSD